MSKSGQISQDELPQPDTPTADSVDQDVDWSPPLIFILGALVVVILAMVVGFNVFRVISGMVFPPGVPLPEQITQETHTNISHGVDEWTYLSTQNPCEVMVFYEDLGSICTLAEADFCTGTTYNDPGYSPDEVATCVGTDTVSVFGRRWETTITTRWQQNAESVTTFDIRREMLWNGPAPEATSTPPSIPQN